MHQRGCIGQVCIHQYRVELARDSIVSNLFICFSDSELTYAKLRPSADDCYGWQDWWCMDKCWDYFCLVPCLIVTLNDTQIVQRPRSFQLCT